MDDILFAAKTDHTEQLVEALQGAWTCSPAEFVTKEGSMLLFRVWVVNGGGWSDSLKSGRLYERDGQKESREPPMSHEGDESPLDFEAIKQAQRDGGELTWLTTRSRPDISYCVGIASRLIHIED